jgi:carboxyl-terminal processing protease
MTWFGQKWLMMGLPALLAGSMELRAADAAPAFKEVLDLLRTNLVNADPVRLDHAAAEGLIKELSGQVTLLTNGQKTASGSEGTMVPKTAAYDGAFGYVRVARVEAGAAKQLVAAMDALASTNKLKGWVLDLRFADGTDYAEAVEVANRFVKLEQPLLDYGRGMVRSKPLDNPVKVPVIVLVNRRTLGAAEALAGVLRKADAGLLLGTNTAGHAFLTKEFLLKSGQRLRVATGLIKLGDGEPLPPQGVKPDILIGVSLEDEKAYLEDPYRVLARSSLAGLRAGLDSSLAGATTNRAFRHRINEAELVRILREGQDYDDESRPARPTEPAAPVVRDPALARALDLLKGLAVVRRGR